MADWQEKATTQARFSSDGGAPVSGSRLRRAGESGDQQLTAKPLPAAYADSISYLRAVVVDGMKAEGPSSLDINVTVAEILDAARRSAATGKTIRMPLSQ